MVHLDDLDSYGLFDHFIQFCLFGWAVNVTWICETEISEKVFFSGPPCIVIGTCVILFMVSVCGQFFTTYVLSVPVVFFAPDSFQRQRLTITWRYAIGCVIVN